MQYQHDINVIGKALPLQIAKFASFGLYNPYDISKYDPGRSFSSYNVEQQGRIAEGIYAGEFPNTIDYPNLK
jgi:hypothetical protein